MLEVSKLNPPEIHFGRDEFDAVFPAVGARSALPNDNRGVTGAGGEIGEGQAVLQREFLLQDDHATIGIDDARVRFDADALAAAVFPLQSNRNARVHAPAAALFAVASHNLFGITQFDCHLCLWKPC